MPGTILPNLHHPEVIGGKRISWLLTIEHGSFIHRLSTDDHHITDAAAGELHHYAGRLPPLSFSESIAFLEDIAEGVSIPFDIVFPDSIADLESKGHRLEGATAELARWIHGTDFSERRIIVRGEVSDPEWGADNEPTSFSVESVVWREDVLVPFEGLRVRSKTWSTVDTLDPAERGLYYPIIFGMPGKVSTDIVSRGWITGSQGVWVDRTRTLDTGSRYDDLRQVVAGHPVTGTRIYLSSDNYVSGERFEIQEGQDDQGNLVSYVDARNADNSFNYIDTDGNVTYGLGDSIFSTDDFQPDRYANQPGVVPVFCGWLDDINGGGGMKGPGGKLIREAGDVLEVMVNYTGKPIDRGRFAAAKPFLSAYKIDAMIDAQVKPWDWIREHLLPILPVSIVTGPDGLYPVVWRFDATAADAIADLDTAKDPRIQRASRVMTESSKIRNSFTLDYAKSIRTGSFYGTVRLNAEAYDSGDTTNLTSLHCRVSQHRYRYADGSPRIVEEKLESVVIYDTATAHAILSWRARALSLGRKYIDLVAPERDYGTLERGDVVTFSDADLYISGWVCLVVDVQVDDSDTVGLRLLRVEDPGRDDHPSG